MIVYAYTDIFARYLLGDEKNKDLLLSFINSVNEDTNLPLLKEVTIKNPFNFKSLAREKESLIDVKAVDENGRQYDIEVQVKGTEHFKYRSLYYWAKLYASQIKEGEYYQTLKPTICINLINFNLIKDYEKMHSCFMLKEMYNPKLVLTDHIIIHFLELQKFLKKRTFSNSLEKWMAYFKYEGKEKDIMEIIIKDDPLLQKAHQSYIQFTRNDELLEIYEGRMKWQSDYKSGILAAEEKGIRKGIQKGIRQGAILDKQNVLIKQLTRKFGLNETEAEQIRLVNNPEKLDAALEEILFAETWEQVLACLSEEDQE